MRTPTTRSPLRGFTLIEVVVVVILVAVLLAIGVVGYRAIQTNTRTSGTVSVLRGVAANQEANFRSRGSFYAATSATDTAGLARLATIDDITKEGSAGGWTGPSDEAGTWSGSAPGKVSAATSGSGSAAKLGLAARDSNGTCHYLVTYSPASGRVLYESTLTSGTCSGAAALTDAATRNAP